MYLDLARGAAYTARAEDNITSAQKIPAPRGLIYDRNGVILAENRAAFTATLDLRELLANQNTFEPTLAAISGALTIPEATLLDLIQSSIASDLAVPVILKEDLTQAELVQLKGLSIPAIDIQSDFERVYTEGPAVAPVLGYVGRVSAKDINNDSTLTGEDFIGKAGIESFYNDELRGKPGAVVTMADAKGKAVGGETTSEPQIGQFLHLTIDGDFQKYFYERLASGLASLGKKVGVGLAINPQNGQILALVNGPSYDNNILSGPGNNDQKLALLTNPNKPLFDRVVSGYYSPGSTIKPLVGVAALAEGVIDPARQIYSPGYLLVPNPYSVSSSSRYLDWRPQGNINMASALAQSSDVIFISTIGRISLVRST